MPIATPLRRSDVAARRSNDGPSAPRVSPPDLPADLERVTSVAPHDDLLGVMIAGLAGTVSGAHAHLTECAIAEASVDRLDLTGATLTDVELDDVRAAELTARTGWWRNVRIAGGRIGTLDLSSAELDSIELHGVRIDYLSLAQARVGDVLLRDCVLRTVDLPNATLSRMRFEGCQADEVDTRGLTLRDLDLRGLEAVSFTDPAALRGATLSLRQIGLLAGDLARALGIDVRD